MQFFFYFCVICWLLSDFFSASARPSPRGETSLHVRDSLPGRPGIRSELRQALWGGARTASMLVASLAWCGTLVARRYRVFSTLITAVDSQLVTEKKNRERTALTPNWTRSLHTEPYFYINLYNILAPDVHRPAVRYWGWNLDVVLFCTSTNTVNDMFSATPAVPLTLPNRFCLCLRLFVCLFVCRPSVVC